MQQIYAYGLGILRKMQNAGKLDMHLCIYWFL